MTISASKFTIGIVQFALFYFTLFFVYWTLLIIFGFPTTNISGLFMIFTLCVPLTFVFLGNENVEVHMDAMGGSSLTPPLSKTLKFVPIDSLDFKRSQKRSFLDRMRGVYKIYDKSGRGFSFNRLYFSRLDFKIIQDKIFEMYGIRYT